MTTKVVCIVGSRGQFAVSRRHKGINGQNRMQPNRVKLNFWCKYKLLILCELGGEKSYPHFGSEKSAENQAVSDDTARVSFGDDVECGGITHYPQA